MSIFPKSSLRALAQTAARSLLRGALLPALSLAVLATPAAWAQKFPYKPIKIVVPYSAGTGSDALARTVAQGITDKTGKTVVVENRSGAGGNVGAEAVARHGIAVETVDFAISRAFGGAFRCSTQALLRE